MSFGIVEVITLLLGLSGFGLQPNPKAPTADQALQYAMPDADLVVHVDVASMVGNNYKVLTGLANQPQIKASPELAKMVRQAVGEIDGFRGIAKAATGLDVTTDISDATLFLKLPTTPNTKPRMLIAARGKFTTQTIDKIGKMAGAVVRIGAGAMIELGKAPDEEIGAIAVTRDGTFLAGRTELVRDRLADAWRAPVRTPSSGLAHAADVITAKPVFAISLAMSPAARKAVLADIGPTKGVHTDIIQRHKLATFSVFRDGIGWTWIDSSRTGLDAMHQMSEGMMELLRAAQIAPRGFAKIMMGALESYRGTNKQIDELIRRKADITKIIESYTGDGSFKVQIDKNPAALRLTARATGKYLSEVVPAGFFIPVGAFGWLMVGRPVKTPMPPPSSIATPPAPVRPTPGLRPAPKQAPKPAQPTQRL
ncbi:MAG: hypothetical protein H0X17_02615 [Deltaproteobacteria bacterium]|nr:hypothetical protein [Deltaproteobacteria bacterium]